jgi:hypothetical protein
MSKRVLLQKLVLMTNVTLSPVVYAKGEWRNYASEGAEEACEFATRKYQTYSSVAEKNIQEIEAYAAIHCPEVNADMLGEGLKRFFNDKKAKWEHRSTLKGLAAVKEASKAMTSKALYTFEPETLEEWGKVLKEASQNHAILYFQAEALKGLEVVKTKAMGSLTQGLDNAEIESHAFTLGFTAKILQIMNIDHEIKRFKNLQTHLTQKILNLLGIEGDQLQQDFQTAPVVAVIDVEFKKNITGVTSPHSIDRQPSFSPWKKGDIMDYATDWGHGDMVAGLVSTVSPKAVIHRYYSSTQEDGSDVFGKDVADHYADRVSNPVIFNCSFLLLGNYYFLNAGTDGIRFGSNESNSFRQAYFFESLKRNLKDKFSERDITGPLDEEQLAFLIEKENEDVKSKGAPERVKTLVQGPKGDQTHLIVASPSNNTGPLVKKGHHHGWIKLLDEAETQEHALVALNYDFTTGALWEKSHSAGEYKDRALVVPAAFVGVSEEGNPLSYITLGGHSSATAILSSFASHVRGHYPELNHLEVKQAILEGANRAYPGYNEEDHGQGIPNLKGALKRAKEIAEGKK